MSDFTFRLWRSAGDLAPGDIVRVPGEDIIDARVATIAHDPQTRELVIEADEVRRWGKRRPYYERRADAPK